MRVQRTCGYRMVVYYEDHGAGRPVVLVHGYLADGHSWEKQETALLDAGFRVISYDRRGGGASSRPSTGHDYDTLAADLHVLLEELDLRETVLAAVGAGSGEVIRYLGAYGQRRVRAAALLAPLPPFPLPSASDPFLDDLLLELTADRPAAVKTYLDRYYNIDLLGGSRVTDQAWQNSFHIAIRVSAAAAMGCAIAWREDFRADVARIALPVLIVQGDQDRVMPLEATGRPLAALLADARLIVIPAGPHAIRWTHADEVNRSLLAFLHASDSTGTTPHQIEPMAHDTITFITAVGISKADVLGFSIGSFIAQEIALTRPALVRKLILASAAPKGAAGMHGWAPEVIGAVGKPQTSPGDYLDVFFTQTPAGRKADRKR